MPELLTASFSAIAGLIETSIYNILSSNIINLIQYFVSIILNKNYKKLKNKALKIDIILVISTIIIPIAMKELKIDFNISIVPLFIILFVFFYYLNFKVHKFYLNSEKCIEEAYKFNSESNNEDKKNRKLKWNKKANSGAWKIIIYIVLLLGIGFALYIIGENLNIVLSNLCNIFNIPEQVLGFALGIITSIPELITFFESQKQYREKENEELGVIEATNNLLISNSMNLFIIQTVSIMIFAIIW